MPELVSKPIVLKAHGDPPKQIEEFTGRLQSGREDLGVARMQSPAGWSEPGQRPAFEEITVVEHENGAFDVHAGQAVVARPGEWVRYSTPDGAEYVVICLPAFSPTS